MLNFQKKIKNKSIFFGFGLKYIESLKSENRKKYESNLESTRFYLLERTL